MIHLILGGARSGKSRFALNEALKLSNASNLAVTYVATATAFDTEMQTRIAHHKAERPKKWGLAEVPLDLEGFLAKTTEAPPQVLLIDCLTLWLNNQLFSNPEQDFNALFSNLIIALKANPSDIFLVANEVGLGVIPMGEVSRQFVDQAGWLNQELAKKADKVTFVAAGLPMVLKGAAQ
ncbi:bifunctional adenosylcobinamide kinase/adenosylcobinamide-phosphate guanylyltransferase [Paraglaciecola sp. 2405UD69-4]|uniref:bifunctional adenosylcobinamide kinase/adenosylcobinamide-phosphate guanylyltransferase n=1 Tax=Paraglaciecola sp. 2405UD69-4 TaxID=3391836 RepID=UPI0039C9E78F